MKFDNKTFRKDFITVRLIDKNISMQQASDEIGISKATVSRIEKGKTPDIDTFLKVLKWLGYLPNRYFK